MCFLACPFLDGDEVRHAAYEPYARVLPAVGSHESLETSVTLS